MTFFHFIFYTLLLVTGSFTSEAGTLVKVGNMFENYGSDVAGAFESFNGYSQEKINEIYNELDRDYDAMENEFIHATGNKRARLCKKYLEWHKVTNSQALSCGMGVISELIEPTKKLNGMASLTTGDIQDLIMAIDDLKGSATKCQKVYMVLFGVRGMIANGKGFGTCKR